MCRLEKGGIHIKVHVPLFIRFIAATMLLLMIPNTTVLATSWAEMEPEEVTNQAEVIVTGTYDFSSKPIPSNFVFQGVVFNVNNVYKGDASKQIIAGIDMFDVGWAKDFQKQGGEFLLFLEESKDADFLVPVAGPNGMIQVRNGKVEHSNAKNNAFYEEILKEQPKKPSLENNIPLDNEKKMKSNTPLYVSIVVLISLLGVFLIYRNLRKNNDSR